MSDFPRAFKLAGASNFRDLGGYTGHGGRKVRWRTIFRSDHLGALTAEDLQALGELGLARVCDFRGTHERAAWPCAIPGVYVHSLAIEPTVVQSLEELFRHDRLTPDEAARVMAQTYRDFVHHHADRFAELFRLLLQDARPLVFHCTAGKDRTGLAAALLLETLGVARDDILRDYLLTNELFRMPDAGASRLPPGVLEVLYGVQTPFLAAAMQAMDTHYGGVAGFLEAGMGIGAQAQRQLAEMYLE